jgi:hypothetical protein
LRLCNQSKPLVINNGESNQLLGRLGEPINDWLSDIYDPRFAEKAQTQ